MLFARLKRFGVVLGRFGQHLVVWVLAGFGWFWLVPSYSKYVKTKGNSKV